LSAIRTTASARDPVEGVLLRDEDGDLIRRDDPSRNDYNKPVTIRIDGVEVEIDRVVETKDASGLQILDRDGNTVPRFSTIWDAMEKLYHDRPVMRGYSDIPVLCHQPHMKPVGVCRMCTVQIWGERDGKLRRERKLLPACQYPVKAGMQVFTRCAQTRTTELGQRKDDDAGGEAVRTAVRTLSELLASSHLHDFDLGKGRDGKADDRLDALNHQLNEHNELRELVAKFKADENRFRHRFFQPRGAASATPKPHNGPQGLDISSPVFTVDHSACVMCDRCVRACGDVKQNNIIARSGKGAKAAIGFDFDDPMGESGCVQCGECMISCPTTAISFVPLRRVKVNHTPIPDAKEVTVLEASDLLNDPMFEGMPAKFLFWQQGLVRRIVLPPGGYLCWQGEPGNTAYLIKEGRIKIQGYKEDLAVSPTRSLGLLKRKFLTPVFTEYRSPSDIIVGEMACLTGTPRTADISAPEDAKEDAVVWEIRRNVLDRLMRLPAQKQVIEEAYRQRSLQLALRRTPLFRDDPKDKFNITKDEFGAIIAFLQGTNLVQGARGGQVEVPRLRFTRVYPGQPICIQGADGNYFSIIRLGHARIDVARHRNEAASFHTRRTGETLGEMSLLGLSHHDTDMGQMGRTDVEIDQAVVKIDAQILAKLERAQRDPDLKLTDALPVGKQTATVTALDTVELAQVDRPDFLDMIRRFPNLRRRLVRQTLRRLLEDFDPRPLKKQSIALGLHEARSVLALDLDRCTRCDECTRGCVQRHGTESHGRPVARMLRDGLRFGHYLVAISCRSCDTPHCMTGCPVDAIHRGRQLQIVIEDHCIGCGLCAKNCPYGSITMQENLKYKDPHTGSSPLKAVNCDLCLTPTQKGPPTPNCVAACPHDAAHRMKGDELLKLVEVRQLS
jgi:Fe-S-cluster-containing dehydrogenase component/CRP-like cAMP-binding protein